MDNIEKSHTRTRTYLQSTPNSWQIPTPGEPLKINASTHYLKASNTRQAAQVAAPKINVSI